MTSGDGIDFNMQGIEEMIKSLEQLATRPAMRAPNAAVRAGASVIIKEMRSRAPKETGSLKKALGQKVKVYKRSGVVTSIVGARSKKYQTKLGGRNPAYYAHLVEMGTIAHRLGKRGRHPGAKKQPFMRPAWAAAAPRARQAVIDKMREIFEKEAEAVSPR